MIGGEFSGYAFPAKSKMNSGAQALSEAPSRVSVDDNDAELDEWLDELGRDGIEVAPDGDEGFTQRAEGNLQPRKREPKHQNQLA